MTVAEALSRFERDLTEAERALAEGGPIQLPAFEPTDLTGPCTVADMQRLERAMQRLERCATSVARARENLVEELDGVDRRRTVAAAYSDHA